jgi:hypothetical protein
LGKISALSAREDGVATASNHQAGVDDDHSDDARDARRTAEARGAADGK